MKIITRNLTKCTVCGKLKGTIEEKYNGTVPVLCKCASKNGERINPSCMCIGGEDTKNPRIIRKPGTDNIEADGELWHNPHFAGPSIW